MKSTFPALLCDIGGTNARFALMRDALAPLIWLKPCKTEDFRTFSDALHTSLTGEPLALRSIFVCAAGPVSGTRVRLTNARWTIDGRQIAREFGLDNGLIFNDFEALALSIPVFRPTWLRSIGAGASLQDAARVIHGPGTGLGTAALIDVLGKWRAIASEGSHSDFAPVSEEDHQIWPFVERREGRLTPETLISGPGLRRLHRARLAAAGRARPDLDEAEITNRAVADPTSEEAATVRSFWRLVARYAGDIALNFLATGGVYLAGGILPRILDLLDDEDFRQTFEDKAPYKDLARAIPVWILREPGAVLHGIAEIARRPDRYAVDYAARAWTA